MTGLEKGRAVWTQRGEFKREVASAEDPRELLALMLEDTEGLPEFLHSMTSADFLRTLPNVGNDRAERLLDRADISALAQLIRLTERQRTVLAYVLRESRRNEKFSPAER